MFSIFYKKYMDWMPQIGGYRPQASLAKPSVTHAVKDALAVNYGNEYRGVGVLIGVLGIAIVFAALAPIAFEVEGIFVLRGFGILKVSMMCLMLTLVYQIGSKSGLKKRWIDSRLSNEMDRYKTLRELIVGLENGKSDQGTAVLLSELFQILQGDDGQIHYNHNKAEQYEAIERAAERISWFGFFIGLVCAVLILLSEFHLIHHHPYLILGTAFLPALVGGVHGINGFLNVGHLAGDHKAMAQFLREANIDVNGVRASEVDDVLKIAKKIHLRLNGHDIEWTEKTQSGNRLIVG